MFLILKKVAGFDYYYNTEKAMWYGVKENATQYKMVLEAVCEMRGKSFLSAATIIPYAE